MPNISFQYGALQRTAATLGFYVQELPGGEQLDNFTDFRLSPSPTREETHGNMSVQERHLSMPLRILESGALPWRRRGSACWLTELQPSYRLGETP